jgi:hypothetical protein
VTRLELPKLGPFTLVEHCKLSCREESSLDSFAQLLDVSPEAEAISFVHGAFLYEYPEADEETHRLRTLALPLRINNCPVSTLNGPIMLRKHLRRSLQPMPQTLSNEIWDDSQFEVLRPGVMLSGIEGELCHTCAGVLVEKGDEVRLTVAEHGFAPATPTAYHANITDKAIGDVCHRFQDTDIGLVHLHDTVSFENNPYCSEQ